MRITKVTAGIQRVVNIGNYENIRIEATAICIVGPQDDPDEAYTKAIAYCRKSITAQIPKVLADATENRKDFGQKAKSRRTA